jgi:hypothetical protein
VNHTSVFARADFSEHAGRFAIQSKSFFFFGLATIDVGLGRAVHQKVEAQCAQSLPQLIEVTDVELTVVEARDIELPPPFAHERSA